MYDTISSFDANIARDPTNIVETRKKDGRMVGPLKSSYLFLIYIKLLQYSYTSTTIFGNYFCRALFTRCLKGSICMDFSYTC